MELERSNASRTADLDCVATVDGRADAEPMARFEAESEARDMTEVVGGAVSFEAAMARARSARKRASSSSL
jgi:hypothetical protein